MNFTNTKAIAVFVFCLLVGQIHAQSDSLSQTGAGLFPKWEPKGLPSLQVNGFYRFFATYQRQLDPYLLNQITSDTALARSIFIGDDAQLPNLLLNVAGKTSDKTTWGFDVMMFQFLNGALGSSYGNQVADSLRPNIQRPLLSTRLGGNMGMNLGLNLYGTFKTNVGTLSVRLGGIQWYAMSDLTMASWKGYNRFMLYERNPWDPMGRSMSDRYNQYFEQGSISQDQRWGNRAYDGIIIEGTNMPFRTSFSVIAGKTELNGGFSTTPNFTFGGKLKKDFGAKNFISYNSFNARAATDSLATDYYGSFINTLEFGFFTKELNLTGEIGLGKYYSPIHLGKLSELMQFKASSSESRFAQVELHYFRISPNIVNNAAVYWNTATPEYRTNDLPAGSVGSTAVLQPFGSAMVRLGQMTNNRQGLNLNVQTSRGKLRFSGGLGVSAELKPAASVITYGHAVNQVTRSRFWRWQFPTGVGPYGRYSDIYRDVYETVNLSDDSSGVVIHKKYFNTMEGQLKYRTKLFGKELYIFSLLQCNSVSRTFSPVTYLNEKAYVRQYIAEGEAYWAVTPGLLVNVYYGYERTLANYLTDIDEITRRPRNQKGEGVGAGLDLDLGRNTRLYLRHRWYYFSDKSFELDHFRGRELSVELKAFF